MEITARVNWDAIIIGAGPSGLLASIVLSRSGKSVLLLEQNKIAGRKLALCGGGSCNIGPSEKTPQDLYLRYKDPRNGRPSPQLKTLYYDFSPELLETFLSTDQMVDLSGMKLKGLGLKLRREDDRLYPADFDAPGLRNHLVHFAQAAGTVIAFETRVEDLLYKQESWSVKTTLGENFFAPYLVLATGGKAYPGLGSNAMGVEWLQALHVPVRLGHPTMGSIVLKNSPLCSLSGLVLRAILKIKTRGKDSIHAGPDQLLITHKGVSGPLVLDLCGWIHEHQELEPRLVFNFVPDTEAQDLESQWKEGVKQHPRKLAINHLNTWIPKSLAEIFIHFIGINPLAEVGQLKKLQHSALLRALQNWEALPHLPTPWPMAMSWTGGCEVGALNWPRLEAKGQKGLYVVGDMVALDRPCGGYSLFFAWASALAACKGILTESSL